MVLLNMNQKIQAQTKISSEQEFKELIETTDYYKKYEDEVIDYDVLRSADTDYGKRFTVEYVLKEKNDSIRTLVFVGDEEGEILTAMYVSSSENELIADDMVDEYTTTIHLREYAYLCTKYVCAASETRPSIQPSAGCATVVGQPCEVLKLFQKPIAAIICKAGVWAACSISFKKVCTRYTEIQDVCTL